MKKINLFMLLTSIVIIGSFSYCSNRNNNVGNVLEEESSINMDDKPFLAINGDIDEIYSFMPYENPFTGITLSEEEVKNNNLMKSEAIIRIMSIAVIDFENKEILIDAKNGTPLNIDDNLFNYVMDTYVHRVRIMFKEGYITFKKTRAIDGTNNIIVIKPAHFNEKGEIEDISFD